MRYWCKNRPITFDASWSADVVLQHTSLHQPMTLLRILTIIAVYLLLTSCIILLVISGVAYGWVKQSDLLLVTVDMDYRLLFGIGIGVSLVCFIGIWLFFAIPSLKLNFIVTFPLLYVVPCVYLYFASPSAVNRYLRIFDLMWDETLLSVEDLQMKYGCCGWQNATDRALSPCPYNYESGCANLVSHYLGHCLKEVLHASAVSLFLAVGSSVILFYFINKNTNTSMLSLVQVSQ